MGMLLVECCGVFGRSPCGKILDVHVGVPEQGVSHGLCHRCNLITLEAAGIISDEELLELENLEKLDK